MNYDLNILEKRIGYSFNKILLLSKAVTHASGTNKAIEGSNERLEFLGDRVLGLIISEILFNQFPDEPEGALSQRYTALVRTESLARVAKKLKLGEFLIMSQGERKSGGKYNKSLLANTCEALIAALFLDGGLNVARTFVVENWTDQLTENAKPPKDAKTALQEWTQANGLGLPEYLLMEQSGPPHAPNFIIKVSINDTMNQVEGSGKSKQIAEQLAAIKMLEIIGR